MDELTFEDYQDQIAFLENTMDDLTQKEIAEYISYLDSRMEAFYRNPEPEPETKKAEGADDSDGPIPF